MKILELGSGLKPLKIEGVEVIHLDRVALPDIEIVQDLNHQKTLPFNDEEFDEVHAYDLVEHIIEIIPLFEEAHRVLKKGGKFVIKTTYFKEPIHFNDPTHYHYFNIDSFDYFDPETAWGRGFGFYSPAKFKILEKGLKDGGVYIIMEKR